MNKHFYDVSFFAYCFLLVFSCMSGLFLDLSSPKLLGIVGLAWSALSLLVFLWVVERVYYFKKQVGKTGEPGLSHRILKSMSQQKFYNLGVKALRSFNAINFLIIICGALYCFWMFYLALSPPRVEPLLKLNELIADFFQGQGLAEPNIFWASPMISAWLNATILLILFLVFWLMQLYVYSNSQYWNIAWLALSLFFLSFFAMIGPGNSVNSLHIPDNIWIGYGWSNIDVLQALGIIPNERLSYFQMRFYASGITGVTFFYLPGLIVMFVLMRNMFSKSLDRRLPLIGLLVLLVLLYVDIGYNANIRQFSLWISGWCLLGCVSIRERSNIRRIYRIHQ